jgi:succinoglycan biosynthesis transport protein ExoP
MLDKLPVGYDLTLARLRKKLTASSGGDDTILRLSVRDEDLERAAELANTWAEMFVDRDNRVYGDQGDEQLSFFKEQLSEAGLKLEEAEKELITFQAHNRAQILENELLALEQAQADFLAKQRQTELILQVIESLLAQVGRGNNSDQATVDQLASLLLQVRALGGVATSLESTMPWQIQINVDSQSNLSQGDQRVILADLQETLLAQSEQLKNRLAEIEPQILSVKQEKQEANIEENRLNRDFEVSEETYTTLSRTVDEKRITSQDTTSGIRLASKTAVPENPTGPRKLFVAIGDGVIGAVLAASVIIMNLWWQKN